MKLKSLLFAAAFAGLFSACSNEIDEVVSNNDDSQQTEQGEAYASFSFLMPNAAQTRTAGGAEVGSSVENQITNVGVYMFNTADGNKLSKTFTLGRTDFTPTTEGGATLYITKKPQEVSIGTFNVYVIVNPTTNLGVITKDVTTLAEFQALVESVPQTTGGYCTNNQFMMTNAEEIVMTKITEENNIKNPALASVNVERLAAKVTFSAGGEEKSYEIKNEKGAVIGSVKFDAYKVINTRNSAYNLRRVGDADGISNVVIGGVETKFNYVIENFFTQKTNTFTESVHAPNYSRKHDTYVAFRKLNATGSQTLAYALENTMEKEAQLTGYSTAVIFRAEAKLNADAVNGEVTENGDLYRYLNTFHASLLDILKSANPGLTILEDGRTITNLNNDLFGIKAALAANTSLTITDHLTNINDITSLKNDYNVEYFVGGFCYYTTWFRHNNDTEADKMGIMEYVMVRNNVYKLSINSVSMIGEISSGTPGNPGNPTAPGVDEPTDGTGNPEIPGTIVPNPEPTAPVIPFDPEQPIVSTKTYLSVSIEVLPWTVRDNAVDL